MFTCLNQSCGAQWQPSEVTIKNEGQGLLFRCPMCGARNHVASRKTREGTVVFEQREKPNVSSMNRPAPHHNQK